MLKLKIATLAVLASATLCSSQLASAQSHEARLAAARACSSDQWWLKGYYSYQQCTAAYIQYYPDLPPPPEEPA